MHFKLATKLAKLATRIQHFKEMKSNQGRNLLII